jgi:hypothetical protein
MGTLALRQVGITGRIHILVSPFLVGSIDAVFLESAFRSDCKSGYLNPPDGT